MSALLWIDTEKDEALDLGDPFSLYQVFAEMDKVGGMKDFPELFGVIEAAEIQDDVDPEWFRAVGKQAAGFLKSFGSRLSDETKAVLETLSARSTLTQGTKSLPDDVLQAVAAIGGLVPLHKLGAKLGASPASLHAAVDDLRRQGKLTASAFEGGRGPYPAETLRWLMEDRLSGGTHKIGFVSLRR